MLERSAVERFCREVLGKNIVVEQYWRRVLERSAIGKCCGEVLQRSVAEECCGEVLWGSVVKECCGEVLW